MKNIALMTMALLFSQLAFGQTKYQKNRAHHTAEYVANELGLSEKQKKQVHDVFLDQIIYNQENTKGLEKEEKKKIYKASYAKTLDKFKALFGAKKARAIMQASNKARKNMDKK